MVLHAHVVRGSLDDSDFKTQKIPFTRDNQYMIAAYNYSLAEIEGVCMCMCCVYGYMDIYIDVCYVYIYIYVVYDCSLQLLSRQDGGFVCGCVVATPYIIAVYNYSLAVRVWVCGCVCTCLYLFVRVCVCVHIHVCVYI